MFEKYTFDGRFQDLLLASIIKCPQKFICNAGTLSSAYFLGAERVATARALFAHFNKHGHFPSEATVGQVIFSAIARTNEEKSETEIMAYVKKLLEQEVDEVDYVVDQVVTFAKERAVYCAIQNALTYHSQGESPPGGYCKLFEEAMKVGLNTADQGYLLTREGGDTAKIISMVTSKKYGTNTGYSDLNKIWPFGWGPGWLISILAPPKRYKCEHPDTEILMFDGTTKRICELKVNDRIMGDDSTPRTVLSCGYGYGPMFKVTQSNGDSYTVNADHVLCLKRPTGTEPTGRFKNRYHMGSFLEITAKEYAQKPAWFQRIWKGYKVGVEFPAVNIPLDPYFLGLWLGDGHSGSPAISVGDDDPEIADYVLKRSQVENTNVRIYRQKSHCTQFHLKRKPGMQNPVTAKLRTIGVLNCKHIPFIYKINSRAVRLQLLAGLIDSDGNHTKNRGFIFVNINEQLCKDICWIAQSLGFKSFVRKVKTCCKSKGKQVQSIAYRTYIQGQISEIPTKVARKLGKNSSKASNRTTIKIKPVGNGQWFGIEIDGNRKYLHSDFTVTHNTAFCINLAMNIVENQDSPVFYYPCEISQELAAIRCLCNITGLSNDDLYQNKDAFLERALAAQREKMESSLLIKGYPSRTATIAGDIRAHARTNVQRLGVAPKAIIIDFAETVKPSSDMKRTSEHKAQGEIYLEARALGAEFNCPVILPDRCNRETVSRAVPSMTSFQGAFEKAGHVDVALGLCSDDNEYMANVIRYFVFLNRHGIANQQFRGKVDPKCMVMTIDEQIPWKPEDEEQNEEAQGRRRGRFRKRDKAPLAEIDKE